MTGSRIGLFGLPTNNILMTEAVHTIVEGLERSAPTRILFLNADCVNMAHADSRYRNSVLTADMVFADGIGLKIAGDVMGCPIKQNVNGTDLFPPLCASLAGTGKRLFLLGASPGVARRVGEWVTKHYPKVIVCGSHDGFFPPTEREQVIQAIADARTDLLLVAMGAPRQDLWLQNYLSQTGAKVGIGVGGLFDFYSGSIPRAPYWMRRIGCEWLYRLYQEPARLWRRYVVGNVVFLYRVWALHRVRLACGRIAATPLPKPRVGTVS